MSVLQDRKYCFCCGTTQNLQKHHIFGGSSRSYSEEDGLWVWLCQEHHTGDSGVHFNKEMMDALHQIGQEAYEENHSRKQFVARYGKNYLEDGNYDF